MPDYGPFPSDNPFGVPTLDPAWQASTLPAPMLKWGTSKRGEPAGGSCHFYADDAKFWSVWANPESVLSPGFASVVEPNFSTFADMPMAEALWGIFRKRWLARFWQSECVRIVVDLNVHPAFKDLTLLGVPDGWTAYATRSHRGFGLDAIEADHRLAVERAGTTDISFTVFGGGKSMESACLDRGWTWIPEDSDQARGRNGKRIIGTVQHAGIPDGIGIGEPDE